MEDFYKEILGKEGEKIFKNRTYVSNNYFIKNKEKYSQNNPDNNPVIFKSEDISLEERLKLPILDSFLTRYVYHNFARWFGRFGKFLGVYSE